MPTLYTPGDAALEARVSTQTIRRWAERGELPVAAHVLHPEQVDAARRARRVVERREAARLDRQALPATPPAA
jgi:predicted site-specific integrase-resolvase